MYAIEYLVFVHGIFKEVVALEVVVVICEDEGIFECEGGGGSGVVEEDLVGGFG